MGYHGQFSNKVLFQQSNIFLKHDLYYPKAAKYFREKANEELQHAEKFIEYQNRRGGKFDIGSVTVVTYIFSSFSKKVLL